jgi:hypothetical protein
MIGDCVELGAIAGENFISGAKTSVSSDYGIVFPSNSHAGPSIKIIR